MQQKELFGGLTFSEKNGDTFYRVSNSKGKTWYFPQNCNRTSLLLYQPSSFKAKLFINIFPAIKKAPLALRLLNISIHKIDFQCDLSELLLNVFHTDKYSISIFCGTPSIHQKLIMQVSSNNKIHGYCKLSNKEGIKLLLQHEKEMLYYLKEKEISGIPECYLYDQLGNQINILIQSTIKSPRSQVIHNLTQKHWEFLKDLHLKTKKSILFEDSDFHRTLILLNKNINFLKDYNDEIINSALSDTQSIYSGSKVEFSASHADFTPWNMFLENGNLFVFDWEYAVLTCPSFIDAYHFFTQTHIYVKHSDAARIYTSYIAEKHKFMGYISNPDFIYKNYLLFIISFYTQRDRGIFSPEIARNVNIWTKLLEYLAVVK